MLSLLQAPYEKVSLLSLASSLLFVVLLVLTIMGALSALIGIVSLYNFVNLIWPYLKLRYFYYYMMFIPIACALMFVILVVLTSVVPDRMMQFYSIYRKNAVRMHSPRSIQFDVKTFCDTNVTNTVVAAVTLFCMVVWVVQRCASQWFSHILPIVGEVMRIDRDVWPTATDMRARTKDVAE